MFICSACISAVILSTETLNVEPNAPNTLKNALEKTHIATNGDIISEKSNEISTETERTNVNSDDSNRADGSKQEIDIEKNTKTQHRQQNIEENIQPEREASRDENM